LLLVADYANVTDNGKLNVMGIFQRLHAREFPARHPGSPPGDAAGHKAGGRARGVW